MHLKKTFELINYIREYYNINNIRILNSKNKKPSDIKSFPDSEKEFNELIKTENKDELAVMELFNNKESLGCIAFKNSEILKYDLSMEYHYHFKKLLEKNYKRCDLFFDSLEKSNCIIFNKEIFREKFQSIAQGSDSDPEEIIKGLIMQGRAIGTYIYVNNSNIEENLSELYYYLSNNNFSRSLFSVLIKNIVYGRYRESTKYETF